MVVVDLDCSANNFFSSVLLPAEKEVFVVVHMNFDGVNRCALLLLRNWRSNEKMLRDLHHLRACIRGHLGAKLPFLQKLGRHG